KLLGIAASRLATGNPLGEAKNIAKFLFDLSRKMRDLVEFSKVFIIPKRAQSEQTFNQSIEKFRQSLKSEKLLIPTKKYDLHRSYKGTREDWRWFLTAEHLGLDIRKSADLCKLAEC